MTLMVEGLSAGYDGRPVVRGVDLSVDPGAVHVVFGINGAGKTTTLMTIAGMIRRIGGTVILGDQDISGMSAHQRARNGLALVPEGRHVFAPLTVEENLRLGGYTASKTEREAGVQRAYDLFPILDDRRRGAAGLLSGGEQQMLAIARGLMSRPKVMLLDEPSMGLAPAVVDTVMDSVRSIADEGVAVLMVEQDVEVALSIADKASVMVRGDLRAVAMSDLQGDNVLESLMGD